MILIISTPNTKILLRGVAKPAINVYVAQASAGCDFRWSVALYGPDKEHLRLVLASVQFRENQKAAAYGLAR